LAAIRGGATGLALRFASASSADGKQGLPLVPDALNAALAGIDVATIHLRVEPHQDGVRIAKWLEDLIAASGLAPELADVAFGLDPLAAVAAQILLDPQEFAAVFLALHSARFRGPFALLDGRAFHEAGATEAQELAAILGSAAWWLRTLETADVGPDIALPFLGAAVATDSDILVSIAKLRALRLLWARLYGVCNVPPCPLQLHAETSRRMLTRDELTDNLLRNTLAAFAAGVGGADTISVTQHIAALGISDRNARALARNVQHLLMEESHLHRVFDPAAGSGAIEMLTEQLAACAWEEFRTIEREGGIIDSFRAGLFPARVGGAHQAEATKATEAAT
jgi:methylmalonyl-CoA mutase